MKILSESESRILGAILSLSSPMTYREIQVRAGFLSHGTAVNNVRKLKKKKLVAFQKRKARTIRPLVRFIPISP